MLKKLVSLIGFPLLVPVAIGHGVWFTFKLLVRQTPNILKFFLLPFQWARRMSKTHSSDDFYIISSILLAVNTLFNWFAMCPSGPIMYDPPDWYIAYRPFFWGWLAINALSCLHESGRLYWIKVWKKKPADKPSDDVAVITDETPENSHPDGRVIPNDEAKPKRESPKPETFESMWDKIQDYKQISKDQADELYAEVIQLLKEKKIVGQDAMSLAAAILNGAIETIKMESGNDS